LLYINKILDLEGLYIQLMQLLLYPVHSPYHEEFLCKHDKTPLIKLKLPSRQTPFSQTYQQLQLQQLLQLVLQVLLQLQLQPVVLLQLVLEEPPAESSPRSRKSSISKVSASSWCNSSCISSLSNFSASKAMLLSVHTSCHSGKLSFFVLRCSLCSCCNNYCSLYYKCCCNYNYNYWCYYNWYSRNHQQGFVPDQGNPQLRRFRPLAGAVPL